MIERGTFINCGRWMLEPNLYAKNNFLSRQLGSVIAADNAVWKYDLAILKTLS